MADPAQSLSAVTLVTHDMAASVAFYDLIGLELAYGGAGADFTSYRLASGSFLNLQLDPAWRVPEVVWGRVIVWVPDVDDVHHSLVDAGVSPEMEPRDAPWGERYFHVLDPAGHEVSIARPLA